jgi:hypothetical protein
MLSVTTLQQAVDLAYQAMTIHPTHELFPFRRRAIYHALCATEQGQALARLAILSAQHVLPIWQNARPNDDMPIQLLDIAESMLARGENRMVAEIAAEEGSKWIDHLSDASGELAIEPQVLCAGQTVVASLYEAIGYDPFEDTLIGENDTDADVDPFCSDAAKWAVAAYAGPSWLPRSNLRKRREFWEWWLKKAIPTSVGT